jgi:hypothetical protein
MTSQDQAPEGGTPDVRVSRRHFLTGGTGAGVVLIAAHAGWGTELLSGRPARATE